MLAAVPFKPPSRSINTTSIYLSVADCERCKLLQHTFFVAAAVVPSTYSTQIIRYSMHDLKFMRPLRQ